jgi:uncharacterized membrane protein YeaQ/YmgE (transglycosylase-associated protein family)
MVKHRNPEKSIFLLSMNQSGGIAGAFIATYLGQALGWYKAGQPAGWIMSIIGAMILLLLYRLLFKRKQ